MGFQKARNNETGRRILAGVFALILILVSAVGFSGCDRYVSFDLKMEGDTFRILQLTDLHFINSEVSSDTTVIGDLRLRDEWVETSVTSIIEEADPDMIVVTGDVVFTQDLISDTTGTNDNYAAFKKAAKFVDSFGIPWAFVFGNHDEEGALLEYAETKQEAKETLAAYLTSDEIKHCLFSEGPSDINGCGNYIINVLNPNGSVNTSLVFFDSGSYLSVYNESTGEYDSDIWAYDYVHDDQLDWYEEAIRSISDKEGKTVPSIVFQHIPLPVYQDVIDAYMAALKAKGERWRDTINAEWPFGEPRTLETSIGEITYYGGVCNKEEQEVCHSYIGELGGVHFDGGHEFDRIRSLGSTKYVFCGHDHRNTFSFEYEGVRLTYGMSIDYSAVGLVSIWHNQNIYDETEQRGGTLITLCANGETEVSQIPFTRNLYQEELVRRGLSE